jgi:hypothetical protein
MQQVIVHSNYLKDWVPFHERRRPRYAAYTSGSAFQDLSPGDVVWLVTGPTPECEPAVCGRLVVEKVRQHLPGTPEFDPAYADKCWQATMSRAVSTYCDPVPAPFLEGWGFWKQAVRGARPLSDDQAGELQSLWNSCERRPPRARPLI